MSANRNMRNQGDGMDLLRSISSKEAAIVIFDPQYRGVLDKLAYGNEGAARGAARVALAQMTEDVIRLFIQEIARVLRPSGHLFLWVDKFHLCEGTSSWTRGTELECVDMITWDKGKFGNGYRTRRQAEYILVWQNPPKRAKGVWMDHAIPDVWCERIGTKEHPHQKPLMLQQRLIRAVSDPGDLVVDPAAGSFSVLQAARAEKREFLGTDLGG